MIDPTNITDYSQNERQLEEVLLWWVCAAGKNGVTIAKCLESLLQTFRHFCKSANPTPFEIISAIPLLPEQMRNHGIGCYNNKARTFKALISAKLDLKTCTVDDLEAIPGIGPKTARCFLIHSRPNQRLAGVDTHLLKFLYDMGYDVPKGTPGKKRYKELEAIYLYLCDVAEMKPADLDLKIWNAYSKNVGKPEDVLTIFNIPKRRGS